MTAGVTPERDQQLAPSKRELVQLNTEDAPVVYANNVMLMSTVWDFKMGFGLVVDANDTTMLVKREVTVMMSPQHAKAFLDILVKHVGQYEAKFGRIPRAPKADEATDVDGQDEPE